jgi:hypothetical protein
MTLETFFDKFDQFADAPDAVAKMRQIVLDLAVKGKLTARDTKKESVESEYSGEPSADELPSNWRLLNFGKFCDIQGASLSILQSRGTSGYFKSETLGRGRSRHTFQRTRQSGSAILAKSLLVAMERRLVKFSGRKKGHTMSHSQNSFSLKKHCSQISLSEF